MTENPNDNKANIYEEKNYEFVRPVPAFIIAFVAMFAASKYMLDRQTGTMNSEYRGEITLGVYLVLFLCLIYSFIFFLREARKIHTHTRLPLFSYYWLLLAVAAISLYKVTSNLYFFEGVFETQKAISGATAFSWPAGMLPSLLARLAVHVIHKPSG